MDLKQIEYFVRVAELGSFTRASMALRIAQPALSRQVRLLEVELRQNLLMRNGRGVTLTEAGQRMLEHGRGILHQVENAREDLGHMRGMPTGTVVLGLPPSLTHLLTVPLARAFRNQWPQARLSIAELLSLTIQDALCSGRLDLGLLYGAPSADGIEGEYLGDEELFAIEAHASPPPKTKTGAKIDKPGVHTQTAEPLSVTELAQRPLLLPNHPNALRMRVERCLADAGLQPRIVMEADSVSSLLGLVAEGFGLTVLPAYSVRGAARPDRFMMRRIGSGLMVQVWLAASAHRPRSVTQLALMDLLREQISRKP